MIVKRLILHHFLALSDHTNLQGRWISDQAWVDIINEHLGLDEEKCVTKHTSNKHMKMLKSERKIDVKVRTIYHTVRYHIANYSNATKGNATFYYIKASHTKDPVYYKKNNTWEELYNGFRVSMRILDDQIERQDAQEGKYNTLRSEN